MTAAQRPIPPMHVGLTLAPGSPGTKKLAAQYGDRLLCVRFRYDIATRKRYTTVELIHETAPWQHTPRKRKTEPENSIPARTNTKPPIQPKPNDTVSLKVRWNEKDTQERIKAAGGRWDPKNKVWRLPSKKALELALAHRMTEQDAEDKGKGQA